ncbi:TraX family protein [Anaerocolumna sp. AGMB13020]|uniref:TraX family protein n=1 Tax=Anaerocolumna sp. AGMB13020 TaxID=3081750 RepID=UPI00295425A5|nr:TraX family protein [Anaerocolumna sp. AGMB13020]WOO35628.1 TraX family protein [Anaerocolumna sp. AGMB13020]
MENVTGNLTETIVAKEKRRGIPGSTLKLIAIFVMLIDHIAATVISNILVSVNFFMMGSAASQDTYYQTMSTVYFIMRWIGRLGFPLFCFLLVEGFIHTRSKMKYVIRLALFCLISEIPFDLAFTGRAFYTGYQNVFFTLLIGFIVMCGFQAISERLKEKKWVPLLSVIGVAGGGYIVATVANSGIYMLNSIIFAATGKSLPGSLIYYSDKRFIVMVLIGAILLLIIYLAGRKSHKSFDTLFADLAVLALGMQVANLLRTDYSAFGILTIAVFYVYRRNPFRSALAGCIVLNIMTLDEITAFFTLIPIAKYNGERGLRLKYVFYAFYPVHLFLLYIICRIMKIV